MIESCVLGPKTGPERQAGYQTNFPPTPWCLGPAIPTVFSVLSDVSCWDQGRMCEAWLGLVGMKLELGHWPSSFSYGEAW